MADESEIDVAWTWLEAYATLYWATVDIDNMVEPMYVIGRRTT